jgi:shikimate kinase
MFSQSIVIVGFMGSGKTSVAGALAKQLNCTAIDLDQFIAARENRTPREIIEREGEDRFRDVETRMLCEALPKESAGVIALGGGTWTIAANRRFIAEHGAFTVWLDAGFELCWKRIEASGEVRPFARSREMARKLYAERRPVYALADMRIIVDEHQNTEDTATQVARAFLRQNADS